MITFHDIRHKREQKGLSQSKLSKLLGITQATLSQWELRKEVIPSNVLSRINGILKEISYEDIQKLKKKKYLARNNDNKKNISISRSSRIPHGITEENKRYLSLISGLDRERKNISNNAPTSISLFSGCGGYSLGFSWAGFNIKGFVELNESFRSIYSSNFPNTHCLAQDISTVSNEDIHNWRNSFGSVDVIFGGPPCQGFSLSGKRDHYDPRNQLFRHFARIVSILQPKVVLLENVRLLTSMKSPNGGLFRDEILSEFSEIGYDISFAELNAKDYGVPQHRERVFFLGLHKSLSTKPSFPVPSHGSLSRINLFSQGLEPYRTFRDATIDLDILESGEKSNNDCWHFSVEHPQHVLQWLKQVPEGCSAHDNPDKKMRPSSGYNTTYKRLRWDEPASTVSTTFGMISGSRNVHPQSTRSLTVREALRCQSFPDSFLLNGNLGSVRTSIGNAVPPLLAYALAMHIKRLLHASSSQPQATC
jgi:DNA (cytosine-5)-methyltransferase 1